MKHQNRINTPSSGVIFEQYVDGKKDLARSLRKRMTATERILWEHLRDRQLMGCKFRRQQVVEGFIADFFSEYAKLVIEVDGAIHDVPVQRERDRRKDGVYRSRGLRVLRFRNTEVLENLPGVLDRISETLKGCPLPPSDRTSTASASPTQEPHPAPPPSPTREGWKG
jgi:very-short-patch-repair endonuclease